APLPVQATKVEAKAEAAPAVKWEPATEKQKAYARSLGVDFDDSVSKPVMGRMIDLAIAKQMEIETGSADVRFRYLKKSEPKDMIGELESRGIDSLLIHWDSGSF